MSLTDIIHIYPRISAIVLAAIISFLSMLATKKFTNQARMKELKEHQKANQAKLKEHKNDPQKMMEIQKEIMGHSMEMMRHSFRPMLVTIVPLLLIFGFVRGAYAETAYVKSWFWYYLVTALVISPLWKKILKVY